MSDANRGKVSTTRIIEFSGLMWAVVSSKGKVLPGPNFYSDSDQNVSVDSLGRLHLKITQEANGWYCAQVLLTRSLGYGIYRFQLESAVDNFDLNVVFGIFTYDPSPAENHRELDIEFSRWGKSNNQNAQYVVQPGKIAQNLARFNMPAGAVESLHELRWAPATASLRSLKGQTEISQHVFTSGVPVPGAEKLIFNLWLDKGNAPKREPLEVVIGRFEFLLSPGATPTE